MHSYEMNNPVDPIIMYLHEFSSWQCATPCAHARSRVKAPSQRLNTHCSYLIQLYNKEKHTGERSTTVP